VLLLVRLNTDPVAKPALSPSSNHRRHRYEPCSHWRVAYNIGSMQPLNFSANRRLTTLDGTPASCLGLAAGPKQDPRCVRRAFPGGINYFFFYGPGHTSFIKELASLVPRKREQIIVATGSGSRRVARLRAARRKLTALLRIGFIDVFFIEYVHPGDNPNVMFGKNGVLDELRQWKESGLVRFVGATAHDRSLARRLAAVPRVDVLMHRFNMAHRKAALEVFPVAAKARTPVVAFTAARCLSRMRTGPARRQQPLIVTAIASRNRRCG
jgi:aryl-alcohol dehydrogenase-like predicted oxidoreductase